MISLALAKSKKMDLFTAWCFSTCTAITVELRSIISQILHLKRFRSLWNLIWPARWETNTIGMTNSSLQKGHDFTKIFLLALSSSELRSIGWGNSMLVGELFQCDISIDLFQIYFQLKECESIRMKSKNQNGAIDFRLMKSLKSIFKQY